MLQYTPEDPVMPGKSDPNPRILRSKYTLKRSTIVYMAQAMNFGTEVSIFLKKLLHFAWHEYDLLKFTSMLSLLICMYLFGI